MWGRTWFLFFPIVLGFKCYLSSKDEDLWDMGIFMKKTSKKLQRSHPKILSSWNMYLQGKKVGEVDPESLLDDLDDSTVLNYLWTSFMM